MKDNSEVDAAPIPQEVTTPPAIVEELPQVPRSDKKKAKQVVSDLRMVEPRYRLEIYGSNGLLKAEISTRLYADMSTRYGDVIRAFSHGTWYTFPEFLESYKNLEKRLKFELNRTPENLQLAVIALTDAGLLQVK